MIEMLEAPDAEHSFPHEEITEAIIGAACEVYNHLGYRFLEKVYQRPMQVELLRRHIAAEIEQWLVVRYKDAVAGEYDAGLPVASAVIVEIKIAPQYDKRDEAQLLNELKATALKSGFSSISDDQR